MGRRPSNEKLGASRRLVVRAAGRDKIKDRSTLMTPAGAALSEENQLSWR